MLKAVHFGAGNIGRGFIGEVLSKNNFGITFVDVNTDVIDYINTHQKYEIEYADANATRVEVNNVAALSALKDEQKIICSILEADLITTSIGMANLERISQLLAKCLIERGLAHQKIDVIANENAINATDQLKEHIKSKVSDDEWGIINSNTGFVNSAIDRQSLSKEVDGVSIPFVEPYYEWVVEKNKFVNADLVDQLAGVLFVDDLKPYIERKLYIVNAEHAVTAYVGSLFGKKTVQEALSDRRIHDFVKSLMKDNARYLIHEYHMDESELDEYIEKTLKRHSSPYVKDDINRVARSPLRKISPNERIIGPLMKSSELGLNVERNIISVAAVLNYKNEDDSEAMQMGRQLKEMGSEAFLREHCGITDSQIIQDIVKTVHMIEVNLEEVFGGAQ